MTFEEAQNSCSFKLVYSHASQYDTRFS